MGTNSLRLPGTIEFRGYPMGTLFGNFKLSGGLMPGMSTYQVTDPAGSLDVAMAGGLSHGATYTWDRTEPGAAAVTDTSGPIVIPAAAPVGASVSIATLDANGQQAVRDFAAWQQKTADVRTAEAALKAAKSAKDTFAGKRFVEGRPLMEQKARIAAAIGIGAGVILALFGAYSVYLRFIAEAAK